MEIRKGGQTLIGFSALIDDGDAVRIEVFDEPELAQLRHRAGLRRLFALQIKDALKYLEKNLPGLQAMGVVYMNVGKTDSGAGGGTLDELVLHAYDDVPRALHMMAKYSLWAHLIKLARESRAAEGSGRWTPLD